MRRTGEFIIATHSPILLAYPNSTIFFLDDTGISEIPYEETEHYVVTKNFLNNYRKLLRSILGDDDSA